jgi:hypothetical protein
MKPSDYPHKLPARCACGNLSVKFSNGSTGVCQRCNEIEHRMYSGYHRNANRGIDLARYGEEVRVWLDSTKTAVRSGNY